MFVQPTKEEMLKHLRVCGLPAFYRGTALKWSTLKEEADLEDLFTLFHGNLQDTLKRFKVINLYGTDAGLVSDVYGRLAKQLMEPMINEETLVVYISAQKLANSDPYTLELFQHSKVAFIGDISFAGMEVWPLDNSAYVKFTDLITEHISEGGNIISYSANKLEENQCYYGSFNRLLTRRGRDIKIVSRK